MCSSNTRVWTEKLRKTYRVKLLKRRVIRSPLYETCRLSRAGSLPDTERDSVVVELGSTSAVMCRLTELCSGRKLPRSLH